jgi:sortase (surface protein transpeptidase)
MRRIVLILLAGLLTLGMVPFIPSGQQAAAGESACFQGTPYCADNAFLSFWKSHGGLEILGLPVSQSFIDSRGLIIQFYERAIMEWHPENEARYQVLLTLLGSDRLGSRAERTAPPAACAGDCTLFAETNHTLRGTFKQYWQSNGGLQVFGFPLTEEFVETNAADGKPYTVQYFERNRFESHPESADPHYQVLLGLLGLESLKTQSQVLSLPAAQVPDYTGVSANVGLPATLEIPAIGVSAPVEQVGLDAQGNMDVPKDPFDTAWYAPGTRPGLVGNAVIAGHVDYHGIGPVVFWRLRELTAGTDIYVTDDAGTRRHFVVQSVEIYNTDAAPRERIFGASTTANLNLVSCTGDFDPGSASYDKRIVVYTTLVP